MKRILAFLATAAVALGFAASAQAQTIIVVTHGSNTDAFWGVVKNGVAQAARDQKVRVQYRNPPTGDLTEMARLIDAAVAQQPDGLVVSIPDPDLLGPSIRDAVASGIPVISINSGADVSAELGAVMHVGQPEYDAGLGAGARAKAAGVTKTICVNHEISNTALEQRCRGYNDGIGLDNNMVDVPPDPNQIKSRVTAALSADSSIDGILAVGPTGCEPTIEALKELGQDGKIDLICFDLSQGIVAGIKDGTVSSAIDQQQYLQGYLPIVVLSLHAKYGLLPGNSINSGPGFVTTANVATVEKYAGSIR